MTEQEQKALADQAEFMEWDSGYAKEQSTRPQTIGYGLVDSPAGSARGSSRSSGRGQIATAIRRTCSPATSSSTT